MTLSDQVLKIELSSAKNPLITCQIMAGEDGTLVLEKLSPVDDDSHKGYAARIFFDAAQFEIGSKDLAVMVMESSEGITHQSVCCYCFNQFKLIGLGALQHITAEVKIEQVAGRRSIAVQKLMVDKKEDESFTLTEQVYPEVRTFPE